MSQVEITRSLFMTRSIKGYGWKPLGAMTAALLMASSAQAAAVGFDISAASLTPGLGYGTDSGSSGEQGGTLLGVAFTHIFAPQHFELSGAGASTSFDLATVLFYEPNTGNGNGNRGIRSDEADDIGLVAGFSFVNPSISSPGLTAIVTATTGAVDDADVDYSIAWNPLEADFGNGGRYRISLNTLSFTNAESQQTLRATVELLSAPELRVAAVPEPGSTALVCAALGAAGLARRRRAASPA
jgi:PEP-CTERM motif